MSEMLLNWTQLARLQSKLGWGMYFNYATKEIRLLKMGFLFKHSRFEKCPKDFCDLSNSSAAGIERIGHRQTKTA
jgi:hypothetical protein